MHRDLKISRRTFLKTLCGTAAASTLAATIDVHEAIGGETRENYYAILFDNTRCIGCNSCVIACRLWNGEQGLSKQPVKLSPTGEVEEVIGPILLEGKVESTEPPEMPKLDEHHLLVIEPRHEFKSKVGRTVFQRRSCMHCLEPPCMYVCPTGAIYQERGVNLTDFTRCFGCQYCVVACPYKARVFSEEKGVPIKCWMCYDRLEQGLAPACVSVCPVGALDFGARSEILSKVRSRVRELQEAGKEVYVWGATADELGDLSGVTATKELGSGVIMISDVSFKDLGYPEAEMLIPAPKAYPKLLVERGGLAIFGGAALIFLGFVLWRRGRIVRAKIKEIPRG